MFSLLTPRYNIFYIPNNNVSNSESKPQQFEFLITNVHQLKASLNSCLCEYNMYVYL